MWHNTDPEAPRRAIPTFSRLVAQGLLDAAEAEAALAAVAAPGAGWPARRAWAFSDAVADWQRARRRAAWSIGEKLAPLLASRAPREALEAAAVAADPDRSLTAAERDSVLREAVERAMAGKVQPGRQKVQPGG